MPQPSNYILYFSNLTDDYWKKRLSLNSYLRKIEAIGEQINDAKKREQFFDFILNLEIINAVALDRNADITEEEENLIPRYIKQIEEFLVKEFSNQQDNSSK